MTVENMSEEEMLKQLATDLGEMIGYLTTHYKGHEFQVACSLACQLGAYVSIVSKANDNDKFIQGNLSEMADLVRNHDYHHTRAVHFGYKIGAYERPKIIKPKLVISPIIQEIK